MDDTDTRKKTAIFKQWQLINMWFSNIKSKVLLIQTKSTQAINVFLSKSNVQCYLAYDHFVHTEINLNVSAKDKPSSTNKQIYIYCSYTT